MFSVSTGTARSGRRRDLDRGHDFPTRSSAHRPPVGPARPESLENTGEIGQQDNQSGREKRKTQQPHGHQQPLLTQWVPCGPRPQTQTPLRQESPRPCALTWSAAARHRPKFHGTPARPAWWRPSSGVKAGGAKVPFGSCYAAAVTFSHQLSLVLSSPPVGLGGRRGGELFWSEQFRHRNCLVAAWAQSAWPESAAP
jgi:hypothetical protein